MWSGLSLNVSTGDTSDHKSPNCQPLPSFFKGVRRQKVANCGRNDSTTERIPNKKGTEQDSEVHHQSVTAFHLAMTCQRVTKAEKQQRHEWAMKQIDKGVGFSELASLVAETWGCSRRQARRVVTEAHKEWMDLAFGDDNVDQRDLLFQCIARLERTARKAEEAGNYACVIGAVAQMNRMMALGSDQRGFRGYSTRQNRQ